MGACQILQKQCIFRGFDTGLAIFLEIPSNITYSRLTLCLPGQQSNLFTNKVIQRIRSYNAKILATIITAETMTGLMMQRTTMIPQWQIKDILTEIAVIFSFPIFDTHETHFETFYAQRGLTFRSSITNSIEMLQSNLSEKMSTYIVQMVPSFSSQNTHTI